MGRDRVKVKSRLDQFIYRVKRVHLITTQIRIGWTQTR